MCHLRERYHCLPRKDKDQGGQFWDFRGVLIPGGKIFTLATSPFWRKSLLSPGPSPPIHPANAEHGPRAWCSQMQRSETVLTAKELTVLTQRQRCTESKTAKGDEEGWTTSLTALGSSGQTGWSRHVHLRKGPRTELAPLSGLHLLLKGCSVENH